MMSRQFILSSLLILSQTLTPLTEYTVLQQSSLILFDHIYFFLNNTDSLWILPGDFYIKIMLWIRLPNLTACVSPGLCCPAWWLARSVLLSFSDCGFQFFSS